MLKVAIISGGYSKEKDISIKTAQYILNNIDNNKYNSTEVRISKSGWFAITRDGNFSIDKNNFSFVDNLKKIHKFDIVLNCIHGSPGEDGKIQSYFDIINMPYTGCSAYQSALTFNKLHCSLIMESIGIKIPNYILINDYDNINYSFKDIVIKLGLPFIIKPNKSGSSIGVYKVYNEKDFISSITKAFKIDRELLLQQYITGREFSIGVMKYKNETEVIGITEIKSHNDFFDYNAKYKGQATEETPALISDFYSEMIKYTAKKAYDKIGMVGLCRSEFILYNNELYFLEMNSCPGLSDSSILPQQISKFRNSLSSIIDNEITLALKRNLDNE